MRSERPRGTKPSLIAADCLFRDMTSLMLHGCNRPGRLSSARSRVAGMGPRSSVRTTREMGQEYQKHKLTLKVIAIAISVALMVLALISIFPRQRNRLLQMIRPR